MCLIDTILTALGVSMDVFAVALCKGLTMKKYNLREGLIIALSFGFFQGLMPIIGYLLGITFQNIIIKFNHWIAFILLSVIGINMIKESFSKEEVEYESTINLKNILPLSIATSIDALAVGITFAFLQVNIYFSALIIFLTTFTLSLFGTKIGASLGSRYSKKSELFGGIILIIIAIKILLTNLK